MVQITQSVFGDDLVKSDIWCSSTWAYALLGHSMWVLRDTQLLAPHVEESMNSGCQQGHRAVTGSRGRWVHLFQSSCWGAVSQLSSKRGDIPDAGNSWRNVAAGTGGLHLCKLQDGGGVGWWDPAAVCCLASPPSVPFLLMAHQTS